MGAQRRLLHQILGVLYLAGEAQREPIGGLDQRPEQRLELGVAQRRLGGRRKVGGVGVGHLAHLNYRCGDAVPIAARTDSGSWPPSSVSSSITDGPRWTIASSPTAWASPRQPVNSVRATRAPARS